MLSVKDRITTTLLALAAAVPMAAGCASDPAPDARSGEIGIDVQDADGNLHHEALDYAEFDLGVQAFPEWEVDGVLTRDPARLLRGEVLRYERLDGEWVTLNNRDGRLALVSGPVPASGIAAVEYDEALVSWVLTSAAGDVSYISVTDVRDRDRALLLGYVIGAMFSLEGLDDAPRHKTGIIAITVAVGFIACLSGTCGATCSSACAPNSVQSFSAACWPLYSSCDCNCFANGGQTPSPPTNPPPTPPTGGTPTPTPTSTP